MRRVESPYWSLDLSAGAPGTSIAEKSPGIPQPQHELVHYRPVLDCNGDEKKKVAIKTHSTLWQRREKGVEAEHCRCHSRDWDRE